jgi:hypothetical protein
MLWSFSSYSDADGVVRYKRRRSFRAGSDCPTAAAAEKLDHIQRHQRIGRTNVNSILKQLLIRCTHRSTRVQAILTFRSVWFFLQLIEGFLEAMNFTFDRRLQ